MSRFVTHRKTHDGMLVIRLGGTDHDPLTRHFVATLATVTPNARPGFQRLSLQFVNARIAQGIDPMSLFEDGPSAFRAALARWHRNESGRFAWDWDGLKVTVYLDDQEDEDISEAINLVLASHFESSRRKYRSFLISFINYIAEEGEDPHAFVTESVERVRYRFDGWLRDELELVVDVLNGQPCSNVDVRSDVGPIDHKAHGIAAARQFYAVLKTGLRLRTGPNPIDIDGLDEMTFGEKLELARSMYGMVERLPKHFGSQYRVTGRTSYAPIPHKPEHTYVVMKAAADELGRFPPVCYNILAVMDAEGPRHHDVKRKMMDAWAASDFGDWIWGANKASDDPEYKQIIFGPKVQAEMRARVDAEHWTYPNRPETVEDLISRVMSGAVARPSMDQLIALKALGRKDVLSRIPLFPASHGRPFTYGGWNRWIRKATESANGSDGALIQTSIGPVRPTAVWLRRAMFTERVTHVQKTTTQPKEIKVKLDQIRRDAGHRSQGAIYRYAASAFPDLFGAEHRERAVASAERIAAVRTGNPLPIVIEAQPEPALSQKSVRLRSRARA